MIALIDVTTTPKSVDIDIMGRKAMLEMVSVFLTSAIGAQDSAGKFSLYNNASDPNDLSDNGRYASVWTDSTTAVTCDDFSSRYYDEAVQYGLDINKKAVSDYEENFFQETVAFVFME